MTFREFLTLFAGCDHPWGELARSAINNERWKGNNALSLSLLSKDLETRLVCHELNVAFLMYSKPIGLHLDYKAKLAQPENVDSSVKDDR